MKLDHKNFKKNNAGKKYLKNNITGYFTQPIHSTAPND